MPNKNGIRQLTVGDALDILGNMPKKSKLCNEYGDPILVMERNDPLVTMVSSPGRVLQYVERFKEAIDAQIPSR